MKQHSWANLTPKERRDRCKAISKGQKRVHKLRSKEKEREIARKISKIRVEEHESLSYEDHVELTDKRAEGLRKFYNSNKGTIHKREYGKKIAESYVNMDPEVKAKKYKETKEHNLAVWKRSTPEERQERIDRMQKGLRLYRGIVYEMANRINDYCGVLTESEMSML